MFNKIMSVLGAANLISEDAVKKGLQKVDPRLKKFFSQSSKYGYPIGAVLGFLQSELSGRKEKPVDRTLRPDEAANMEIKRQESLPADLIGAGTKVASGAALGGLGGAVLSGISGLLNQEGEGTPQQQQPQEQPQQQPQSPREQAIRKHAEMTKKKKLIDTLAQEFEQEYGQGNLPTTGVLGATQRSPTGERIEQGTPGGEKSELLKALQETKRLLGG